MPPTYRHRYRCEKCDYCTDDYYDMQEHECEDDN